jgi:hypothetical protein
VHVVSSPLEEEYRRLCSIAASARDSTARLGSPRVSVDVLRLGSARRAVLLRSEGRCENPAWAGLRCCRRQPVLRAADAAYDRA